MADYYTVKQGDHVSSLAEESGLRDYRTIWNHPNNAELKQKRQNPNVLLPGDRLFIPDRQERVESRSTDQKHPFKLHRTILKLRLVLEDVFEKPIANAQCVLAVEGDLRSVTTTGDGKIEQRIPPNAHSALLIIQDLQTPFCDTNIPIKIGHLDPVEEISGQRARLNNLGYFPGDGDERDPAFRSAVEEFQCDNGLHVDGVCAPGTQAKLKQVHGC